MQATTHPISQEQLMAYLDGELQPDRASVTATHLEHCRECQGLAADLQIVSRRLLEWQVEGPSSALDARVGKAVAVNPSAERPRKKVLLSFLRMSWAWGAVVVGIFLIALMKPQRQYMRAPLEERLALERAAPGGVARRQFMPDAPYLADRMIGGVVARSRMPQAPPPPAQPSVAVAGLSIIRTAELSLTTRAFDKIHSDIDSILASHQGYIAHLGVTSPPDQGRSLNATLKVPAGQLDTTLSALKKLGRVDAESQTGQEVTQQVVDLAARLSNARNSEQRLTQILRERTGKLGDVLAVEEQIDNVRGQIEQMEAEQKNLSHQIAFASIDLKIAEEYSRPLTADHSSTLTRLRNAAVDGYRSVVNGAINVILFLLAYGPALLVIAGILFIPARALWRKANRVTA